MKIARTDILVIGGGIAGCFAAIRARKMGKSVAVLEKTTLRRGGSVGPGMDHLHIGIHLEGWSFEEAIQYAKKTQKDLYDPNVMFIVEVDAFERVKDFEEFGVPVKEDDGSLRIVRVPERHFCLISYRGVDTKVKLGKAVEKSGAQIFERTMGIELLKHDDRVVGAVALNTRTGELTAFLANATILCTGDTARHYIAPDGPYNTYYSGANTGDAEVMAYRAGAKMVNMEFLYMDYVTLRQGGGLFGLRKPDQIGKLVNYLGESLMNTPEESQKRSLRMHKEIVEGKSPIFWDLSDLPEDVHQLYERDMDHEYPITKEWYKQRNIDFRKDRIPTKFDPCCITGGILVDETFQTSVPGLYAAGGSNPFTTGIGGASVSGDIAVKTALEYLSAIELPDIPEEYLDAFEKKIRAPLFREIGVSPKELELTIRSIATNLVGYFKNEHYMNYALEKIIELRDKYGEQMIAKDAHELMRCCEVKSIMDYLEMHIRASLYRKETRYRKFGRQIHHRTDYPDTDPKWQKWVVLKKDKNDEMVISTTEVPELKEDLVNECKNSLQ